MTQNDWLSSYFGDDVAEDLEKTAQAHLLVKLAEQAGLDINQLSEEELMQLVAELQMSLDGQGGQPGAGAPQGGAPGMQPGQPQPGLGGPQAGAPGGAPNPLAQFGQPTQMRPQQGVPVQGAAPGGQPAPAGGGLSPEMAKEAQAKFEEADALGRVMAHAYVEELDKIASARDTEKTASRGGASLQKAKDVAGRASSFAKKNKGAIGAAAGAGAAGFGAGRMSKKASSVAFEKLANDRAFQILQTLGIDPTTGQPLQDAGNQQPQGEPDLDQAVDARALQMLADAGYDPQQVATAYDQAVGGGEAPQQ